MGSSLPNSIKPISPTDTPTPPPKSPPTNSPTPLPTNPSTPPPTTPPTPPPTTPPTPPPKSPPTPPDMVQLPSPYLHLHFNLLETIEEEGAMDSAYYTMWAKLYKRCAKPKTLKKLFKRLFDNQNKKYSRFL